MFNCSVIIPVHNGGKTIAEAIRSVVQQKRTPIELIVVDDESTDDTTVAAEQAFRDVPFACRLLRSTGFRQAGLARNYGAATATGEFLAFLDADDAWETSHLDSAYHAFESCRNAVAYCSRVEMRTEAKWEVVGRVFPVAPGYTESDQQNVYSWLLSGNTVHGQTLCVRKDAFKLAGGYHSVLRCYEDYWLTLNLAQQGLFILSNDVGCRVRTRTRSLSRSSGSNGTLFMSPSMYSDRLAIAFLMRRDTRFSSADADISENATIQFVSENFAQLCRAREFCEALTLLRAVASRMIKQPLLTFRVFVASWVSVSTLGTSLLLKKLTAITSRTPVEDKLK